MTSIATVHLYDGLGNVVSTTVEGINNGSIIYGVGEFVNSGWPIGTITAGGVLYQAYPEATFSLSARSLPNFGVVPIGGILLFKIQTVFKEPYDWKFISELDLSNCPQSKQLLFNTLEIPNGNIESITNEMGAKTWVVSGSVDSLSELDGLSLFASPVKTGVSTSGYQYALSSIAPGEFIVKDENPPYSYTFYHRCFIQSPIRITKFSKKYLYSLTIYQSYYSDVAA
jgi:hypothetical protein